MRLEVVARIHRVIKDLWPNAEVSVTHTVSVNTIVFLGFMSFCILEYLDDGEQSIRYLPKRRKYKHFFRTST